MAPFKMLKLAPGNHSPGEMKVMETVRMPAFKWLCETESFVSPFTFISLFFTRYSF